MLDPDVPGFLELVTVLELFDWESELTDLVVVLELIDGELAATGVGDESVCIRKDKSTAITALTTPAPTIGSSFSKQLGLEG